MVLSPREITSSNRISYHTLFVAPQIGFGIMLLYGWCSEVAVCFLTVTPQNAYMLSRGHMRTPVFSWQLRVLNKEKPTKIEFCQRHLGEFKESLHKSVFYELQCSLVQPPALQSLLIFLCCYLRKVQSPNLCQLQNTWRWQCTHTVNEPIWLNLMHVTKNFKTEFLAVHSFYCFHSGFRLVWLLKSQITFLPLINNPHLSVFLSNNTPINHISCCGFNMKKCVNVNS